MEIINNKINNKTDSKTKINDKIDLRNVRDETDKKNIKIGKIKKVKSTKGILLTLLMLIFLILILSEIITYTLININYDNNMKSLSTAESEGLILNEINSEVTAQLQQSLQNAYSIIEYNSRNPNYFYLLNRNVKFALESLMMNGSINGNNFNNAMGYSTLTKLTNVINNNLVLQGINVYISKPQLFISQDNSSSINATYTALIKITTPTSTFVYPINATSFININNTFDLSTFIRGSASLIKFIAIPKAQVIGNIYASSGSLSPYLFDYGTIINISGAPSCNSIPTRFQNSRFILATANSINLQQNICNMGGLITYTPLVFIPTAPYLAYNPSSNIFSYLRNGSQVLLYGNALELLNTSQLISAVNNNNYFEADYLPSYIELLSNGSKSEGKGLASFNIERLYTPYFSGQTTSNITTASSVPIPAQYTISFWINKNITSQGCGTIIASNTNTQAFMIYSLTSSTCAPGSTDGTALVFKYTNSNGATIDNLQSTPIPSNIWTFATVVFSQNTLIWYINGNKAVSYTNLIPPLQSMNQIIIGPAFSGSITNIQIYNTSLPSASINKLYNEGIMGMPISNTILWLPLEGNNYDYSSNNNNGIGSNIYYKRLRGYFGDSLSEYRGFNTSLLPFLNCINISECSNTSYSHIYVNNYIGNSGLIINNTNDSEAYSIGFFNAVLPKAINMFGNSYISEASSVSWLSSNKQPYSFSIWLYPLSSNGVIIDEFGSLHDTFLSLINDNVVVGYYNTTAQVCNTIGTIPLNRWSNIGFTYNGANTLSAYINGIQTFSANTLPQRIAPSSPYYYLGLYNTGTTYNCGTLANYQGYVADYQIYNSQLSQTEMQQLYSNNYVAAVPPSLWMPLSTPYISINTTKELESNNYGLFELNGKPCSVGSILNYSCGISYIP
ncbi:MAG: LamG-like jellyroll fold domain-containing protein [Candidatus Micrarchaeia archaeon]